MGAPLPHPCSQLSLSVMSLFHLSRHSLISLNSALEFSQYKLCHFPSTFTTKYFIYFHEILKYSCFLDTISDCTVYKIAWIFFYWPTDLVTHNPNKLIYCLDGLFKA